jgi:hypothetical protein
MHTTMASVGVVGGRLRHRHALRRRFRVTRIGHRVPSIDFEGRVHSVFEHACNIALGAELLTIGTAATGDGPTLLRLAGGVQDDLRECFTEGEFAACRGGWLRTPRVDADLMQATRWWPAPTKPLLPAARIQAHLADARTRLALQRLSRPSVLVGAGAPALTALGSAVQALDVDAARCAAEHLVGWGEGLTPAGDDALIGLLAGLDALLHAGTRRRAFRDALGARIGRLSARTTPIAAHGLRLAADGHFNAPLLAVRDALLTEADEGRVAAALRRALSIGASSGADMLSGLLLALQAWAPTESTIGCK